MHLVKGAVLGLVVGNVLLQQAGHKRGQGGQWAHVCTHAFVQAAFEGRGALRSHELQANVHVCMHVCVCMCVCVCANGTQLVVIA